MSRHLRLFCSELLILTLVGIDILTFHMNQHMLHQFLGSLGREGALQATLAVLVDGLDVKLQLGESKRYDGTLLALEAVLLRVVDLHPELSAPPRPVGLDDRRRHPPGLDAFAVVLDLNPDQVWTFHLVFLFLLIHIVFLSMFGECLLVHLVFLIGEWCLLLPRAALGVRLEVVLGGGAVVAFDTPEN